MTILAKPKILELRQSGDILIEPFNPANVKNNSVDVTLGEWYWVESQPYKYVEELEKLDYIFSENTEKREWFDQSNVYGTILNPYDKFSVRNMWGGEAKRAEALTLGLPGIPAGSKVIPLEPGQNILAHTNEFIGGTDNKITTMMKARSSVGRSQVTICRCAGLGDIGFCNRYVMEISNQGLRTVLLVVGMRLGQIIFFETTGIEDEKDAYYASGKYQKQSLRGKTYEELLSLWDPEMMIPKMWVDVLNP